LPPLFEKKKKKKHSPKKIRKPVLFVLFVHLFQEQAEKRRFKTKAKEGRCPVDENGVEFCICKEIQHSKQFQSLGKEVFVRWNLSLFPFFFSLLLFCLFCRIMNQKEDELSWNLVSSASAHALEKGALMKIPTTSETVLDGNVMVFFVFFFLCLFAKAHSKHSGYSELLQRWQENHKIYHQKVSSFSSSSFNRYSDAFFFF
jgi:hypothetical protein